ncbi:MAG: hypothetical protein L0215_10670 [Gemmataceae bacterium]|nr:hypothetical protein [Gemmataceae bacterium]
MLQFLSRLKVVGLGLLLGSLFAGCSAATQLPSTWDFAAKFDGWIWFMSGPLCTIVMGISEVSHPLIRSCLLLAILTMPLIVAHPIRPSLATACLTFMGLAFWFAASFLTIIWAVWGA